MILDIIRMQVKHERLIPEGSRRIRVVLSIYSVSFDIPLTYSLNGRDGRCNIIIAQNLKPLARLKTY